MRLLVLYGFYDFQLTDPVSFASSDLIGNHYYSGGVRADASAAEACAHIYDTRAWQEYQRYLPAKQNVAMLDASRWFPDADRFGDAALE